MADATRVERMTMKFIWLKPSGNGSEFTLKTYEAIYLELALNRVDWYGNKSESHQFVY